MSNTVGHEPTEYPLCPMCGGVERDVYALLLQYDGDRESTHCGACGAEMTVTLHILHRYTTRVIEEKKG